ncbi:hypothetical protein Kim5_CH00897 [Rhizobium sp. Kim5]|uniref:glycosyltransferase family 2 protein n=1 Tax=Rhizobium sp. Kim5 TaxID=2020311 RepID=UPI0001905EAF|nr:glycosyltransferase family 2 protein [Rhizobium sp. Kim5]ARQ57004.1 hypothetical protein Kim5_CH00897 [Rhizobium sp. Kim5]
MKISFITTIYWTADDIVPFAKACCEAAGELGSGYEVIFVNDGSPDNGLEIARALAERDPQVIVVDLSRNFGQHKALWTGLGLATGDLIMILDGDLEEDPRWAIEFFAAMKASGAEVVYGVQQKPKGRLLYRLCRNAFYRMLDIVSDFEFPRDVSTARLMTRRYVAALLSHDEKESFFAGLMHVTGFKQIPLTVHKQTRSPTTYTFAKLLRLFLVAITAFSITPLIGVFLAGITISASAFLFILFLIARYFITGVGVPGWTSVMAALILFSGILTLFNGVIAIYIGTIFLEVKRRPRAIVTAVYRHEATEAKNAVNELHTVARTDNT